MLPALLVAAAAAWLLGFLLVLAPRKPGYDHVRHSISELGEKGAPHERLVAFAVFLPVGFALLGAAWLLRTASPPTAALALCVGLGYAGAALFPCDPGSPVVGSPRQAVHNLFGGIEYGGGGFALLTLARDAGTVFQLAGFLMLATVAGLTLMPPGSPRGALQRVAEFVLFATLAGAALALA